MREDNKDRYIKFSVKGSNHPLESSCMPYTCIYNVWQTRQRQTRGQKGKNAMNLIVGVFCYRMYYF